MVFNTDEAKCIPLNSRWELASTAYLQLWFLRKSKLPGKKQDSNSCLPKFHLASRQ